MLELEDLGHQSAAAIAQESNKFRSCYRFLPFTCSHIIHLSAVSSLCNSSCAAAASTTTPAGPGASITRPMAFPPPAASTRPTATPKTSATPPWPPARFTTRSVGLHPPSGGLCFPTECFSPASPPPAAASDSLPDTNHGLAPHVPA